MLRNVSLLLALMLDEEYMLGSNQNLWLGLLLQTINASSKMLRTKSKANYK
jgi:hypothetical protein